MFKYSALAVALLVALVPSIHAQNANSITGVVRSAGDVPVADATVTLPELRRETATNNNGEFVFTNLPSGNYLVNVSSERFGGAILRLQSQPEGSGAVTIELDKMVHSGGISVTATGVARGLGEIINPVDVLADEDLQLRRQSSLGETLAQQPGVSSTSYGQASSRPVIRGLGQDRIRILENGLDTGDVSSIGPDHAVASDPLTAEQIEVVRGPATVLWGANAIGGVVNILDGRVPDRAPTQHLSGTTEIEYGSNAEKKSGAIKLDGGQGNFAWHVDLFARDQDDYDSPAPRILEEEEHHEEGEQEHEEPELDGSGAVENSWAEAQGVTLGASYVTDRGFIGLAVSGYDTEYGIPGHHHHHEEHEEPLSLSAAVLDEHEEHEHEHEEHAVHSELEQRRIDLHSQLDKPFAGFKALRVAAGWRDYNHVEVEGDELGTRFDNTWTEARFDLHNEAVLGFEGTLGFQYVNRDFAAFGDEAFVMPTNTDKYGLYIFEETEADPIGFQFGLRFDEQRSSSNDPALPDRDFSTWTVSTGAVWEFSDHFSLAGSLNRPERAPTPEELYADGPHAATFAFEQGNPNLDPEVGLNAELSVRAEYDDFEIEVVGFLTRYNDFIYLRDNGEELDGFEVLQFVQADTEFSGFEMHGHYEFLHTANAHVHLGFSYDRVDAELRDSGDNLPRIPPQRARLALVYLSDSIDARLEGWWVDDQHETAEHETETPGYEMVNFSVAYTVYAEKLMHKLMLRARNLFDQDAYNHTSFIKYHAPLPGRDLSLVYRVLF